MHQNRIHARRHWLARIAGPLAASSAAALSLTLAGCGTVPWGQGAGDIRGGYAANDKLTAILPSAGQLEKAGNALSEGIRAARGVDDSPAKPTLDFVGESEPEKVPAAVANAVKSGATYVVGPLQKPAVDALVGGAALKAPTLALNRSAIAAKPAANLYQFALAPETEGIDAANKAHAAGLKRALMLYAAGDAGKRRADAFRGQWKRLGGTLAGEQTLDPAAADLAPIVKKLLKSKADFLFLSASPEDARRAYPLVRAQAANLPVVATSEVNAGSADAARDKVLNGLYFVELPWILGVGAEQDPLALSKVRPGTRILSSALTMRLYAMGIDAYRLPTRLAMLSKTPGASFPGETGTLSVDAQGRVERQLALGRFVDGSPRAVSAIEAEPAGSGDSRPVEAPATKPVGSGPRQPKPEPRKPSN